MTCGGMRRAGRVRARALRSRTGSLVAATASSITSRRSTAAIRHSRAARLDLREVEHLVDQPGQALALLDDDPEESPRCAASRSRLSCRISENARIEVSGVRSSCVTVEMKSSFRRSSSCSRALAARSSAVAAPAPRLLLELVAVGDDLRRLVEDAHDLVEAERLLLDDRGDHHPRRRRADRAGERALDELHQFGVGLQRRRRRRRRAGGRSRRTGAPPPRRAEEAGRRARAGRRLGACRARKPAPATPDPAVPIEDVDEQRGLAASRRAVWRAPERDADVERRRWRAGSRRARASGVEPSRPNSCSGRSSAMPNGPRSGSRRQPARLARTRAAAACRPRRETGAEAAERAGARAALPVHAAEDGRRELRHRREADQADRDERVGLAGEPEVEIAKQQYSDDRAAPDAEQQCRSGRAARPAATAPSAAAAGSPGRCRPSC